MACEVCEHCHGVVSPTDKMIIRDGCSYHDKCHKCYVCSETNLLDAEVFKGVIFCSSCSKRIFEGCSTVKKAKNTNTRSHKRRSPRTQERRRRNHDGIIQMTTLACSSSTTPDSGRRETAAQCKSLALSPDRICRDKNVTPNNRRDDMKKSSVEMGMITDVTQELLKEMRCPVPEYRKSTQHNKPKEKSKKKSITDLRIAELGASTEIANMALRNKSEVPVIIKSETKPSFSTSGARHESDRTSHRNEDWLDSAYSSLDDSYKSDKTRWMDRTLGSLLRIPYAVFKRNILDRSSLISIIMSAESNRTTLSKRLKFLFHQEITDHQKRGIKRLYSTINRQKIPHKLGWLHLVDKVNVNDDNCSRSSQDLQRQKRCKHFRRSHSYRCMRAQVMRLAGPTSSELADFRERIMNLIIPNFLWTTFEKRFAIMVSQSCGPSSNGSNK